MGGVSANPCFFTANTFARGMMTRRPVDSTKVTERIGSKNRSEIGKSVIIVWCVRCISSGVGFELRDSLYIYICIFVHICVSQPHCLGCSVARTKANHICVNSLSIECLLLVLQRPAGNPRGQDLIRLGGGCVVTVYCIYICTF